MFTVALIGADGAGKSTIACKLQDSSPLPIKYLYMGINPASSNYSLPTSRLVRFVRMKIRQHDQKKGKTNERILRDSGKRKKKRLPNLRAFLRIFIFLSEEYYRQCISWIYQIRGFIVLFDRHFAFDYDVNIVDKIRHQTIADRLHHWLLSRFYSRPDLVLFLDAPPAVLFDRKGEGTLDYLEDRRKSFLEQGKQTPNFIIINAAEPVEKVLSQVSGHVLRFYENRTGKSANIDLKN